MLEFYWFDLLWICGTKAVQQTRNKSNQWSLNLTDLKQVTAAAE